MLRPSYSELMESINTNELVSDKITSRYTIVLAAAKRARQIIDGAHPLTYAPTDRAVSIAVKEMSEGKLLLQAQPDLLDGTYELMLRDQLKSRSMTGALSKDDLREELKDNYAPDSYTLEDEDVPYLERYDDALADAKDDVEDDDDFDLYENDEDYEEA